MTKVRKAVIAAAGFGTRFLPQTKAMPKEMLPIIDKPIIQYIVEELVDSGIEEIIIVTGYHKRSIEDHFDQMSADLRENLIKGKKNDLLNKTERISGLAKFAYIRQKGPYGNATPLLNAEHLLGGEPFVFAFADDFVMSKPNCFQQLIDVYDKHGGSVLSCIRADNPDDYKKYGFVVGEKDPNGLTKVQKIVEKPGSFDAVGSDIASVSGYLFEPELFKYLREDLKKRDESQEFIMQPSLQRMAGDGRNVWGLETKNGKYFDTGNKVDYIKTVIDFALEREDIGNEIRNYLKNKLN